MYPSADAKECKGNDTVFTESILFSFQCHYLSYKGIEEQTSLIYAGLFVF
jgi:hypothetical protein